VRRDLARLNPALSLHALPVLRPPGPAPAEGAEEAAGDEAGVAAGGMPGTLRHLFVSVRDEESKYKTLQKVRGEGRASTRRCRR
jgi:hypothetical protein